MLDLPESVCPGQARFEYPATSVLFSNRSLDVGEEQVSDEQLLEAARAIRPYLAELVGADADRVDGELAALLARSGDDEHGEVEGLILDCLMRNPATHDWAARFLIDQRPADAAMVGRPDIQGPGSQWLRDLVLRARC